MSQALSDLTAAIRELAIPELGGFDMDEETANCLMEHVNKIGSEFSQLEERIRLLEDGCAEFRRSLYEWSQAYPIDVFPEPPYGQHGKTVDACSAAMGRHVTKRLLEDFDKLVPLSVPAPDGSRGASPDLSPEGDE